MNRTYQKIWSNPSFRYGFIVVMVIILMAIFAPLVAPEDPYRMNLSNRLQGPSLDHPMGTDELGRDYFSRILYGARISLLAAAGVTLGCLIIGVIVGIIAGYVGGIIDEILMRIVDIFLAFPSLILSFAIAGLLGPSMINLIIALIATGWVSYSRVIRSAVLVVKEQDFIVASKAIGCSQSRILTRHIIPNIIGPIIVLATLDIGTVILGISGMSYLGLGVQPPVPEWGSMLNSAQKFMVSVPSLMIFPGVLIFVTVFAFNMIGDALRDAFDPKNNENIEV